VSNTAHIRYERPTGREAMSGSANWAFDNGTYTTFDPRIGPIGRTRSQFARLAAVLLAVSSMSSGPDPWCEARQQRSQLTVSSTFQASSRRRITIREARRMALETLYRAEAERAAAAQAEAERGINWEEVA
jgi:hypothetical protein